MRADWIRIGVSIATLVGFAAEAQVRDLRIEKNSAAIERGAKSGPSEIAQLPSASKRWALIVGVDAYEDKQISPLYAASNDANALADAFSRYAGFPKEQVILLASNQPTERQPTRGNVLLRLANLARMVPKDGLLLFAFAGHGIERNNQAFLLPADAKMSDNIRILQSTALSVTEIKDWVQEMSVKQVIILLDACRNDPTAGRAEAPNRMTEAYRRGFDFDSHNSQVEAFATLYATRVGERAYEYAEKKHGYFSWAVVEGLRGRAANDRGEVTLGSLEKYLQDTVPRQIGIDLGSGRDQRPFADVRGFKAGELVLAKIDPKGIEEPMVTAPAPDPRVLQLEEWERVRSSRDIKLLSQYQARNPGSPFAEETARRIEALEWEAAKTSNSPVDYRGFTERHPNSLFADQARTALKQLEERDFASKSITEILREYEEAYRNRDSQRVSRIWPSLAKRDLARIEDFFRIAKAIELRLDAVSPARIESDKAIVQCRRTMRFSDERTQQRSVEDVVTIGLRQAGSQWVIESVR
jgi:hypothetical protein